MDLRAVALFIVVCIIILFFLVLAIVKWIFAIKRQMDWRRFKEEFGLDHWAYYMDYLLSDMFYRGIHVIPRPRDGTSKVRAVLGQAADRLQEAFDRENALQRTAATKVELNAARNKTRLAKRRFWYLHDLAIRVVCYPDCYKCSYEEHLSRNIVHRAS